MMKSHFIFIRKNYTFLLLIGIFILLISGTQRAKASHAMALDLTYKHISGNEYVFTLSFYRDCDGENAPASPILKIESATCHLYRQINLTQSGPIVEISSICSGEILNTTCNGGTLQGVQKYVYTGTFILPGNCPDWVFSYSECCRNNQITNLASKKDIYIEATLNNSITSVNSSPLFSTLPVPYVCNGQDYNYHYGVIDSEGDSLVYNLINPLEGRGKSIGYTSGYTALSPIQTTLSGPVQFDNRTGHLSFTPDGNQLCVVAVQIKEYRNGRLIGSTMRDMQIVVAPCSNSIPYLLNGGEIQNHTGGMLVDKNYMEVCPGESINFEVSAKDDDGGNFIMNNTSSSVINNASFITIYGTATAKGIFSWNPDISDIGIHTFTVGLEDNACPIKGIQTYSFTIHVLPGTEVGADRFYCPSGDPIQLTAIGGTNFQWTLLDESAPLGLSCTNCSDPIVSPAVTSTYIVTSNFSGGCRNKDTITVFVVPDFNLLKISDTLNLCSMNDGVGLNVNPESDVFLYKYSWSPSESLTASDVFNPIAKPAISTMYYATATSPAGCQKSDSIFVEIQDLIEVFILPGDSIEVCDSTSLDLFLLPQGKIFSETFDHGIDTSNWVESKGGTPSAICGSEVEEAYYFNNIGTRSLVTKDLNVLSGGIISFYIKAGSCNQCVCDKPENDEQDENMYLEYSVDSGSTWVPWQTFDADIYALNNSFESILLTIPDNAKTVSTRFRWHQINHLLDKDVWMLDEIKVSEGLGEYTYKWTPSNTLSNDTIPNPVVFPYETTTYTVEVTDKNTGCVYKDDIKVKFKNEFEVITHPQVTYCPNDPAFKLQVDVQNGKVYTYNWNPTTNISNPTIANPEVYPNETTNYAVIISDVNTGCYRRQEILVTVPPAFNVTTLADTSLCLTEKLELKTTVSPNDNYEYLWRPIQNLSDQAVPNPITTPKSTTEYIVFVKNATTGCTKSDTINIVVHPSFNVETTETVTLCPNADGIDIEASASPGSNFAYLWNLDSGNDITDRSSPSQFVKPSTDTVYHVLVNKIGSCWKRDSVKVKLYNDVLDLHASNDTIIYEEDYALLSAWGAKEYLWKQEIIGINAIPSISVSPKTKTIYTVYGNDECYLDSAKVIVDVIPFDFFIPNLITPNGDNLNETFHISNLGKRWNLEIYNRWGKLVYKEDQYMDGWKPENDQNGVFFYNILDTKTNLIYKGWLHVVR